MRELAEMAAAAAERLRARGETVAVSESSSGGLVSAALLAVPGASAYFVGGAVVYTGAARAGLLARRDEAWRLTGDGLAEAARVAGNHRLWEMYLIAYADIAPSHVDRDADQIEHVLGEEMVTELRRLLQSGVEAVTVPPSPHRLEDAS